MQLTVHQSPPATLCALCRSTEQTGHWLHCACGVATHSACQRELGRPACPSLGCNGVLQGEPHKLSGQLPFHLAATSPLKAPAWLLGLGWSLPAWLLLPTLGWLGLGLALGVAFAAAQSVQAGNKPWLTLNDPVTLRVYVWLVILALPCSGVPLVNAVCGANTLGWLLPSAWWAFWLMVGNPHSVGAWQHADWCKTE